MTKIFISFGIFTLILLGVLYGIKENFKRVDAPSEPIVDVVDTVSPDDIKKDEQPNQNQNTIKIPTDEQLQAYTWVWKEIQMNDGTIVAPNKPDKFSITFTKEGNVNGRTDCNGFGGTYKTKQGIISFGPFMSTLMYCEGSQEQEFTGMFSEPLLYIFDSNDNLVLLLKYDSGSVLFEKAQKIN